MDPGGPVAGPESGAGLLILVAPAFELLALSILGTLLTEAGYEISLVSAEGGLVPSLEGIAVATAPSSAEASGAAIALAPATGVAVHRVANPEEARAVALGLIEARIGKPRAVEAAARIALGAPDQVMEAPDARSRRIRAVLGYAAAHLAEDLSVERLAEIACLSPRQFTRVVQAETGQTPGKVIERMRVEAARTLVEGTTEPIEEIARLIGFADPERMRRAFLRAFDRNPQDLRRAARGRV